MTAPRAFTAKTIESLKPDPAKRLEIPDPGCRALYLVIQTSGQKAWAARYRKDGKPAKLTLGRWPMMGLAEARRAVSEVLAKLETGADPAAEKKARKADAKEAALTGRDKLDTLLRQYAERRLNKLKAGALVKRELERHLLPVWGDRDVQTITKRDCRDALEAIADSGRVVTANRVRAYASAFFAWLADREVIAANPVAGIRPLGKEVARDRVLTDDEIRWLWGACDVVGYPWGPAVKIMALTGQRLGEVAGMKRQEVVGDVWHLPPERVKNGRAHAVPLPRLALEIIGEMPAIGSDFLLFTTSGTAPISGFSKARSRLASAMQAIADKEAGRPVTIAHWGFHDLRRSVATGLARLGVAVRVTEAILNHVSGTGGGIVAVYQRHDFAAEKRAVLEAWAAHVAAVVAGEARAENVIALPARA